MRGSLIFFCLVAVSAATAQKTDLQPAVLNAPLIPFDQLNAMTIEQRTAYANTFNHPSEALDTKGASSYQTEALISAPAYVGVTGYNAPGYGNLGWNGGSQSAGVSRGSGQYESPYRNDGDQSERGGRCGDNRDDTKGSGWRDNGERSEKWGEKGGVSSGYKDNGYRSSITQKGPYAYGYDDGHKSARGYSDSLPKDYPYQIIGQHGFVFEKRYSRASGLMNPITPESLSHLGYRQKKKDEIFVPPY